MSWNNIMDIFEAKYFRIYFILFRLKLFHLFRKFIYFKLYFLLLDLKLFYVMIPCHLIAFRYWLWTGDVMEEYLELLESQRPSSGVSETNQLERLVGRSVNKGEIPWKR